MANIKGKNIVMIIAPQNFRDEELQHPRRILKKAGGNVTIASTTTGMATGMFGAKAEVDIPIKNLNVDTYDAVIFVGGIGSKIYFEDKVAHNIARQAVKKDKVLGAICIAPSILANAGLLRGKSATVFKGNEFINILKANGANYTANSVTSDGKIITAEGPNAAKAFGKTIVKALR